MGKLVSAVILGFAASWAFAQQQPPQAKQEQLDKQTQERVRAERAAGGTHPTTPEEREGASVGEGPHKQFKPAGAARREHNESSSERAAGRGATR
jgi:hypothetical protein